jgi:hypothetical protein
LVGIATLSQLTHVAGLAAVSSCSRREGQYCGGVSSSVSAESRLQPIEEVSMATKDKNSKKSMEKKPAQKTLKEKRQARKDKK